MGLSRGKCHQLRLCWRSRGGLKRDQHQVAAPGNQREGDLVEIAGPGTAAIFHSWHFIHCWEAVLLSPPPFSKFSHDPGFLAVISTVMEELPIRTVKPASESKFAQPLIFCVRCQCPVRRDESFTLSAGRYYAPVMRLDAQHRPCCPRLAVSTS